MIDQNGLQVFSANLQELARALRVCPLSLFVRPLSFRLTPSVSPLLPRHTKNKAHSLACSFFFLSRG
jgi:hypothetical protein